MNVSRSALRAATPAARNPANWCADNPAANAGSAASAAANDAPTTRMAIDSPPETRTRAGSDQCSTVTHTRASRAVTTGCDNISPGDGAERPSAEPVAKMPATVEHVQLRSVRGASLCSAVPRRLRGSADAWATRCVLTCVSVGGTAPPDDPRRLWQLTHAGTTFARSRARSGRWATGSTWSATSRRGSLPTPVGDARRTQLRCARHTEAVRAHDRPGGRAVPADLRDHCLRAVRRGHDRAHTMSTRRRQTARRTTRRRRDTTGRRG